MKFCASLVVLALIALHASALSQMKSVIDLEDALSVSLPPNFAAFSVEVPCAKQLLSNETDGTPRTSYINMMGFLSKVGRSGTTGPNLRIGGNSADLSVYRQNTTSPLPEKNTYRITNSDLQSFSLTHLFNGSITVGLNLGYNNPDEAVWYYNAVNSVTKADVIEAFEIGNEPDLYFKNGDRSPSYDYTGYHSDFARWAGALGTPKNIQGAVFCCKKATFEAGLDDYVAQYATKTISSVSYHHYPLNSCDGNKVQLPQLLTPEAATSVRFMHPFANWAIAQGVPFYVGEGNSVACGGAEGVSNTFAATLWSVDTLFNAASVNITRWNFHGCPNFAYTPIGLTDAFLPNSVDNRVALAMPLYYGMWAFTDALAKGARVVNTTTSDDQEKNVVVWTTVTDNWSGQQIYTTTWKCSRRISIIVLNKRMDQWHVNITLQIEKLSSSAAPHAFSRTMRPSSGMHATDGIQFGGLSFDGSTTGLPSGTPDVDDVPIEGNKFVTVLAHDTSLTFVELFDNCQ